MFYRACLCFSDEQAKAAEDLRRALDRKLTPKALVGLAGANGPVPTRIELTPLSPLEMFPGGQLSEDIEATLSSSDGLVVLCSFAAASNFALNRVIDRFMALDRSRRVFAVIAPDAPDVNEIERDFFPPALLGRGPLAADLRDLRRGNGVAIGDGYKAGLLHLHAELAGVSVQRLAEEQARELRTRTNGFAALAAGLAATLVAAAGYGVLATHNASEAQHARQAALQQAEEAAHRGQAESAARAAEAAEHARAGAAAEAQRTTLREGVQSLVAQAGGSLDAIAASQTASPSNLRQLRAVEDAVRRIGAAGWVFGVRSETIVGLWEKLGGAYAAIGQGAEAQHVQQRFSQFSLRLAQNEAADPAWRAAYAAGVAALYGPRMAKQDRVGALAALKDAARIDAALCGAPARAASVHASACLAVASLELRRARAQVRAEEPIDSAALTRAHTLLTAALATPNDAQLRANGPALQDQIVRLLASREDHARN